MLKQRCKLFRYNLQMQYKRYKKGLQKVWDIKKKKKNTWEKVINRQDTCFHNRDMEK